MYPNPFWNLFENPFRNLLENRDIVVVGVGEAVLSTYMYWWHGASPLVPPAHPSNAPHKPASQAAAGVLAGHQAKHTQYNNLANIWNMVGGRVGLTILTPTILVTTGSWLLWSNYDARGW